MDLNVNTLLYPYLSTHFIHKIYQATQQSQQMDSCKQSAQKDVLVEKIGSALFVQLVDGNMLDVYCITLVEIVIYHGQRFWLKLDTESNM